MMTTSQLGDPQSGQQSRLGGSVQSYQWQWQGQSLEVVYETLGNGTPVLLLPAFSTVSTREELKTLAQHLATQFQVVALDWPGFGQSSRPPLNYNFSLYTRFLQDFVSATFDQPIALVAAGHAAGCALHLATQEPATCAKLVLVAPTWRGPLAAMSVPFAIRKGVRELVRSPLLGQALYALNTQPAFLKLMYRRHVFVDDSQLTPQYIGRRYDSTQQSGARYAPAAFVTGGLDPVQDRAAFLAYFESLTCPAMVVVAEQAPPSSLGEMEATASLGNVQSVNLPGSLGLAEEFGEDVAQAVMPFLTA